jgi:Uma2 family endonuclease
VNGRCWTQAKEATIMEVAPMDVPGPRPNATLADLEALPEGLVGELIDGVLYASPRPRFRHSYVQGELAGLLRDSLGPSRTRWLIVPEPELRLGRSPDVLVPDLAAWPAPGPTPEADGYVHVAPPWLCEVLSPSTARLDWTVKRDAYQKYGVEHLWLVDPAEQRLHVLGVGTIGATYSADATVTLPPFDVPLNLALLWPKS